jgi:hypothetical protein
MGGGFANFHGMKPMPVSVAIVLGSLLCGLATMSATMSAQAFDANQLGQGGSLQLEDLTPLINQSAQLKREVSEALVAAKKQAADVVCTGNRFPGQWTHLGGMRASPYACDFGGKWLLITATVRVSGPNGQVYDSISAAAMKNASKVAETKPNWQWTSKDPDEQSK